MENMDQKVIVYDDACPLCKAYTAGFVKAGWLKQRSGFSGIQPEMMAKIDLDRARHEIPLLDMKTGEVVYGLQALFLILGERMPMLKPLFKAGWFKAMWYPVYQIITYNRRIIAGSGAPATGFDCAPDVNLFYRWLYIFLGIAGAVTLYLPLWNSMDPLARVLPVFHLLIPVASFFVSKKLDFFGHWATIALASALVSAVLPVALLFKAAAGFLVACWMWWLRKNKV
jgi:predicted DCC family thiol-disulfide oxidoreductase YuxK